MVDSSDSITTGPGLRSRRHPSAVIDSGIDNAGFPEPELALALDRVGAGRRRASRTKSGGIAPIAATRTLTICTGSARLSWP